MKLHVPAEKSAFSLFELLLAITVIAVLAVVLGVGAANVKEQSQRVRCANNLRQIGQLLHIHTSERNGSIPLYIDNGRKIEDRMWQQRISGEIKKKPTLFQCPAVKDHRIVDREERSNYYYFFAAGGSTDYGLNDYLGDAVRRVTRISQIKAPARTVFVSERQNVIFSPDRGGAGGTGRASIGMGKHPRGANVLFVDGHLEFVTGTPDGIYWKSQLDDISYWNPLL